MKLLIYSLNYSFIIYVINDSIAIYFILKLNAHVDAVELLFFLLSISSVEV